MGRKSYFAFVAALAAIFAMAAVVPAEAGRGHGKGWKGGGGRYVQNNYYVRRGNSSNALAAGLNNGAGGTVQEATQMLWNTYQPYMVWYYLGAFGLVGTVGMIIFYFATRSAKIESPDE